MSRAVPFVEKPVREASSPSTEAQDLTILRQALAAIPNEEDSLTYDDWRNTIFAIHFETAGSEEGLALAHEFSMRSPKYDGDFLDSRVWPYIRHDRDNLITGRSILARAREHGWEEPVEDDFEVLPETITQPDPLPGIQAAALPRTRFQVLSEDDLLSVPRPRWLIKGVLPEAELGVIYGASGSGKSFMALDLFAAVARGVEWRGCRTKQSRVVYVAAEGQGGVRNRLEAYRRQFDVSSGLRIVLDAPNLLRSDAKPLAEQIVAGGGADVIVLDTLAQVSPGGDENSAEDMGRVLLACRHLRRATGAMIVLIHHAGKDLSKGARGWSGLKAAADVELEVNRQDHARWLKVTKNKDGDDGAEFNFRLLPVVLGEDEDEDGDEITSCVVEHLEQAERGSRREPKGKIERLVWRAAHELAELGGDELPIEGLISAAASRMPHDVQAGRDRRREFARKALLSLVDAGFLSVEGDEVRLGGTHDNS
jgi:hypothetical protein